MTSLPAKKAALPLPPVWQTEDRPVPYDRALAYMEARANLIREKGERDLVWLLEHPPVYTAGTSAEPKDLLNPRFPVYSAGRGGQYTYHGPGQRTAYVMIDLNKRGADLKKYVFELEQWIIETLTVFNITGERRAGRVGIWVDTKKYKAVKTANGQPRAAEAKIAAIGVRVRKWVAYHGIAINLDPDLGHYNGIVPCGLAEYGVTSFKDLGVTATMQDLDRALKDSWGKVFG